LSFTEDGSLVKFFQFSVRTTLLSTDELNPIIFANICCFLGMLGRSNERFIVALPEA